MLTGNKLVMVTKILYSQWMKNNIELFDSSEVKWDGGKVEEFFKSIHKNLGLDYDVDDFFYYMNTVLMNEENLKNGTLNSSNIVSPRMKMYKINVSEVKTETHKYYGFLNTSGYFTRDQLEENVYELYTENYLDLWDYTQYDSEFIDGDGDGVDVEGVELEKVLNNESSGFNKFLDSLNESEIDFLKKELEKRLL